MYWQIIDYMKITMQNLKDNTDSSYFIEIFTTQIANYSSPSDIMCFSASSALYNTGVNK